MNGFRHLIQCHCVLPQFRKKLEPVFHKFVVFSVEDDEGEIIPKFCECNNCGVVHKIVDYCKSEIIHTAENKVSIMRIEDIKASLTPDIVSILSSHNCDISIWENTKFILDEPKQGYITKVYPTPGDNIKLPYRPAEARRKKY